MVCVLHVIWTSEKHNFHATISTEVVITIVCSRCLNRPTTRQKNLKIRRTRKKNNRNVPTNSIRTCKCEYIRSNVCNKLSDCKQKFSAWQLNYKDIFKSEFRLFASVHYLTIGFVARVFYIDKWTNKKREKFVIIDA